MSQLLFRNRWFALLWAVLLCFSISRFFDVGGGQEQLAKAADDIRTSRTNASRVAAARAQSAMQQDMEDSQVIRGRSLREDGDAGFRNESGDSPVGESEAH